MRIYAGLTNTAYNNLVAIGLGCSLGMAILLAPAPKQVLIACLAIATIVFSSIHVWLGLAVLIFITYTRFSDTLVHYHGLPSIAQPWVVFLIVIALGRWVFLGERPYAWKRPMLLMLGFLLISLISLMIVRDVEAAELGMGDLLKDLLVAMTVIVLMRTPKEFTFTVWALILAGGFLGSISVFQYWTDSFLSDFGGFAQAAKMHMAGEVDTYRISGSIGDPNFFGQIMLVLLPLAMDRTLHAGNKLLRCVAAWCFSATALAVFFTFSRGDLIAVFAMIVWLMRRWRPSPMLVIGLIMILVAIPPLLPERYLDRLVAIPTALTSSQSGPSEDSLRGRLSELLSAALMVVDHPLLGVGINNYPSNYQDYAQKIGLDSRHSERHAHNMYLEWMAETGIVGTGILLAILWFGFKSLSDSHQTMLNRNQDKLAGMIAAFQLGVIGYSIAALFLHTAYPRYFWLLMAIAFGIANLVGLMSASAKKSAGFRPYSEALTSE